MPLEKGHEALVVLQATPTIMIMEVYQDFMPLEKHASGHCSFLCMKKRM
jgi:hypothetical protein